MTVRNGNMMSEPFSIEIATQVECKYTVGMPYVVFAEKTIDRFTPIEFMTNKYSGFFWSMFAKDTAGVRVTEVFDSGACGYGVTQALRPKNKDQAFDAVSGAVSASIYNCLHAEKLQRMFSTHCQFCLTIPAVVIKGKLYTCRFDGDQMDLEETEYAYIRWQSSTPFGGFHLVFVMTEEYTKKFATKFRTFSDELIGIAEQNKATLNSVPRIIASQNANPEA